MDTRPLHRWAEKIGPDTTALVTAVLARRHPQQAHRSCIGLQRLAKCYGDARLEAAAARALAVDSCSYRGVESPSATRGSSPTGCAAPGSSIKPASRTSTSDTAAASTASSSSPLADGRWVREHLNILICGPTGIGKSWLTGAFAHSACRNGHSALYVRVSRLLSELAVARADGSYPRRLESLAKTEVLVMDDWGLTPFGAENRLDLLKVLKDRHGVRSTVVTSQLPVDKWHDVVGDPTLGDAILNRLVHNAYKLDLKGDSMRRRRRPSTRTGNSDS